MQHTLTCATPALPARGATTSFEIASRSVPGQHYPVTVGVTRSGAVAIDCGCPARLRCWHIDTLEQVYVANGEAERTVNGVLVTTEAPLITDDEDDPFRGLLGEAV